MGIENMFGVVLWTDSSAQKAVVWCEDHGDLAFYTPCKTGVHDGPSLDAGDLIQFDMTLEENLRRVHNPQLLEQSHSKALADSLTQVKPKPKAQGKGQVIRFSQFARANEPSQPLARVV